MGRWGYAPDESDDFLELFQHVINPLEYMIIDNNTSPLRLMEAAWLYNEICKNPKLYYKPEEQTLSMARNKLQTLDIDDKFEDERKKLVADINETLKREPRITSLGEKIQEKLRKGE